MLVILLRSNELERKLLAQMRLKNKTDSNKETAAVSGLKQKIENHIPAAI